MATNELLHVARPKERNTQQTPAKYATTHATDVQQHSLKALSGAVLARNKPCNSHATTGERPCNNTPLFAACACCIRKGPPDRQRGIGGPDSHRGRALRMPSRRAPIDERDGLRRPGERAYVVPANGAACAVPSRRHFWRFDSTKRRARRRPGKLRLVRKPHARALSDGRQRAYERHVLRLFARTGRDASL